MQPARTIKGLLWALLFSAGVIAAPASAQINFNISLAPPAPQVEIAPTVAPGYVWAPGYWAWAGERHIWVRGRPIVARTGYLWEPDRWEERNHGYYRHPGRWEHDPNFKKVKVKKEKKFKDRDDDHDNGKHGNKHGKHGKGKKHES